MEQENKPAKSLILLMADLRRNLTNAVNNSGLPTPVTFMIVNELAKALEGPAEEYYQNEKAAYEAMLREAENGNSGKN